MERHSYIPPISECAIRGITLDAILLVVQDPCRMQVLGRLIAFGALRSDDVLAALETDLAERLTDAVARFEPSVGAEL